MALNAYIRKNNVHYNMHIHPSQQIRKEQKSKMKESRMEIIKHIKQKTNKIERKNKIKSWLLEKIHITDIFLARTDPRKSERERKEQAK